MINPSPFFLTPVMVGTFCKKPLSYKSAFPLVRGQMVEVPIKKKNHYGIVWHDSFELNEKDLDPCDDQSSFFDHKVIILQEIKRFFDAILPEKFLIFLEKVSDYNMVPLGKIIKSIVCHYQCESITKDYNLLKNSQDIILNKQQKDVVDFASHYIGQYKTIVLEGITGSGKTETFLTIARIILEQKKQVLIMVPEIALTQELVQRFERYFGTKPLLWHNQQTPKQKKNTWNTVFNGGEAIVVGARSALFLPFQHLGLIVVDEEHDSSYKQEEQWCYNARDMAVLRASIEQLIVILSSATPCLETYHNALEKKYAHLRLDSRFSKASLPSIEIIDLKKHSLPPQHYISQPLEDAMKETLDQGEQVLLYINRRGFAPIMICPFCSEQLECPSCTIKLVWHQKKSLLKCHYCNYTTPLAKKCPSCQQFTQWFAFGPGIERVAKEAQSLFPSRRLEILSSDLIKNPNNLEKIICDIKNKEVDIIVGTQMIAKGHDFKNLTLVGIIDANAGLNGCDLRANEKTFQILYQVGGRAGRDIKPGKVLMQTYHPNHNVLESILEQDQQKFYENELSQRKMVGFPPFTRLVAIIISDGNLKKVTQYCMELSKNCPSHPLITVLGPTQAPIEMIRNQYRFRFLINYGKKIAIQPTIEQWLNSIKKPSTTQLRIDMDPINFF
jgi:primosomal protein N' (replication factor Y)